MPYYGDSGLPYTSSSYYSIGGSAAGGSSSFANHSSLMTGVSRYHNPIAARYSPHLSTISESPIVVLRRYGQSASTTGSTSSFVRPIRRTIDTADIDVTKPPSSLRSHHHHAASSSSAQDRQQRHRLRRDRPTIKIRSQALKDNPALREYNERHEKTVGELLVEKFLIKDKQQPDEPKIRLYHQASLGLTSPSSVKDDEDDNDDDDILAAMRRRVTRRMTRRRSSADVQPLDPEQIEREARLHAAQAVALDTLVAEEQAEIESEVRRGTFVKKHAMKLPGTGSDVSGTEEELSVGHDHQVAKEETRTATRHGTAKKKKRRKSIEPVPVESEAEDDQLIEIEIPEPVMEVEEEMEYDDREKCDDLRLIIDNKIDEAKKEVSKKIVVEKKEEPKAKKIKSKDAKVDKIKIADKKKAIVKVQKEQPETKTKTTIEKAQDATKSIDDDDKNEIEKESETIVEDKKPTRFAARDKTRIELKRAQSAPNESTTPATPTSTSGGNFKIEACNSVGDFSTLYVTTSAAAEPSVVKTFEQFRESVRLPAPRRQEVAAATVAAEVSLPMRQQKKQQQQQQQQQHVDSSRRNSVYLTLNTSQNAVVTEAAAVTAACQGRIGADDGLSINIDESRKESSGSCVATAVAESRPAKIESSVATSGDDRHNRQLDRTSRLDDVVVAPAERPLNVVADVTDDAFIISKNSSDTSSAGVGGAGQRGGADEFVQWWDETDDAAHQHRHHPEDKRSVTKVTKARDEPRKISDELVVKSAVAAAAAPLEETKVQKPREVAAKKVEKEATPPPAKREANKAEEVAVKDLPIKQKSAAVVEEKKLVKKKSSPEKDIAVKESKDKSETEGAPFTKSKSPEKKVVKKKTSPEKELSAKDKLTVPISESDTSRSKSPEKKLVKSKSSPEQNISAKESREKSPAPTKQTSEIEAVPFKKSKSPEKKLIKSKSSPEKDISIKDSKEKSETEAADPFTKSKSPEKKLVKKKTSPEKELSSKDSKEKLTVPIPESESSRSKSPVKKLAVDKAPEKVKEKSPAPEVKKPLEAVPFVKSTSPEKKVVEKEASPKREIPSKEKSPVPEKPKEAAVEITSKSKPIAEEVKVPENKSTPLKKETPNNKVTNKKLEPSKPEKKQLQPQQQTKIKCDLPRIDHRYLADIPEEPKSASPTDKPAPRSFTDFAPAKGGKRRVDTAAVIEIEKRIRQDSDSADKIVTGAAVVLMPAAEPTKKVDADNNKEDGKKVGSSAVNKSTGAPPEIDFWSEIKIPSEKVCETTTTETETSAVESSVQSLEREEQPQPLQQQDDASISSEEVVRKDSQPSQSGTVKKISKWTNQDNLNNADDELTPINSKEVSPRVSTASVASTTAASSTTTKKKIVKRKKSGTTGTKKKSDKAEAGSGGSKVGTKKTGTKKTSAALKKATSSAMSQESGRNSPSAPRPSDLSKLLYQTPAILLTATPRDLRKVRRAKVKRKKPPSRTPSLSSDSTGSTRSTATGNTTSTEEGSSNEDGLEGHKRLASTRSNDSGFDGSPRLSTPSQSSDNHKNADGDAYHPSGRITPPATNLPRFKKYEVTDFNFLKVLGKGSFGKVLLAELRGTECVYAVKCLKKDVVLEDDDVECTLIERKVLTLATRHPYLCHLFCTFQTTSHLFFVMEYLNGGDLMFHIQNSGRFSEARAKFYAAEIWSGLIFLHKKGIVYRDLKLDNVLLDYEGHIRIADFGMCKLQIFLDRTADTFCGTPDYMAPEIIKGLKYNQAVDWWSFGVLLYEMLTGQSPFSGCDEDELFWSICNERPFIPRYLSQSATDLLVCLLEKDAGRRIPGHEIACHSFFCTIAWDKLERRTLEPPFKPAVEHTLDTRYFDTAFTAERPRLTLVPEQILTSMDQNVFRGFSYTNPNATD
ncbi:titin-like [Trichogramma pretiosum]|uniref:titin-like n=1 Tax=Trichogramma pretiosum TaxID=7493 RepID=UPI0006C9768D|nr:titin-like [Trichogramma pretiosum]